MRRLILLSLLLAIPTTANAGRRAKGSTPVSDLPPWVNQPNGIKLEIAERLVLEKGQYEPALPLIAQLRAEGFDQPILDLLQGIALREVGMQEDSERLLLAARKRLPADYRTHEALCVLYADQGKVDAAVAACEKATKVDDEADSAWNNLGFLYLTQDRAAEALEAMQRAVDLNVGEARYRNNLALAQVADGDPQRALKTFRTTGTEADANYNVGFAVERFQGVEEALRWYRLALQANADHVPSIRAIDRLTNPESEESNNAEP